MGKFNFPANIVILDIMEDSKTYLLSGWSSWTTWKALIDVEIGELMFRFHDEQVLFNIFEVMCHLNEKSQCDEIK